MIFQNVVNQSFMRLETDHALAQSLRTRRTTIVRDAGTIRARAAPYPNAYAQQPIIRRFDRKKGGIVCDLP